MSTEMSLEELKAKHHELEVAIEVENSRPMPDASKLASLKKQKLKVKESIEQFS